MLSLYNSVNHARSLEHLRATLVNVARHLSAGGFFLFDYVLPEAFESGWEWSEQMEAADRAWTLQYRYEKSSGQATCLINQSETIRQLAFEPHQISAALQAATLEVVRETSIESSVPNGGRKLVLAKKP